IAVEPGPIEVTMSLPWGTWRSTERVPTVGEAVVELPARIGTPPLRNRYAASSGAVLSSEPLSVWFDDADASVEVRDGIAGVGPIVIAQGQVTDFGTGHSLIATTTGDVRWSFPLNPTGTLIVDTSPHYPRAEPLSVERLPAWDLLVTAGRLDAMTPEEVVQLTSSKWTDFLLGLAGAYGTYARGDSAYLGVVVDNLTSLDRIGAIDTTLLQMSIDSEQPGIQRQSLVEQASRGAVPLFRWGVPLALRFAAELGLSDQHSTWVAGLERLAANLVPTSIWTMWTEG
ncbi:MAG: hypothetical protein WD313_04485, partial [Acidimicrobiia bacterium]